MLYAVSVIVNRRNVSPSENFPDGWNQSVNMPTFYLNSDVQGIVSADHAENIARKMFTDLGHDHADVHVHAVPTINI